MMNKTYPSGPQIGFIIVCDKDGDPIDTFGPNSSIDFVFNTIRILDRNHPDDTPHSAWQYGPGGFSRLLERFPEIPS